MTSEANAEEDLDLNFSSENANTNEEQIRIEAWLDEHPDFFQEYLIRKGIFYASSQFHQRGSFTKLLRRG